MKFKWIYSYAKQQRWDVWLRTTKQRLAAFTFCLMLLLGILVGGKPHGHIDVNPPTPTNQVTIVASGNSSPGTMTFSSHFGKLPDDRKS